MTISFSKVGYSKSKAVSLVRIAYTNDTDYDVATEWVDQAAQILNEQWPRGGPINAYKEKIVQDFNNDQNKFYGLPCSYLLIEYEKTCIGHGRLTECFESAGGNAAAATFIIISQYTRGQGMGSALMSLLEEEAKRLGYHYIYLWTKTAISFYEKIGYRICQRVSLKRACLKMLKSNEVESLETFLLKRQSAKSPPQIKLKQQSVKQKKETVLLPPDDDDITGNNDVWLRKRLVENVGSVQISFEKRLEDISNTIQNHPNSSNFDWCYQILNLPWQAQIGPSCGLAALRMVREHFLGEQMRHQQLPSLLGEAQERGYTTDGEVFNANHLRELANVVCGIDCEIWSTRKLTPSDVCKVLSAKGVFIIPYDSNARTRLPCKLLGQGAHYGIIIGILAGRKRINDDEESTTQSLKPLQDMDSLEQQNIEDVYLVVQHSLSPALSIARFCDFLDSNGQLVEVDNRKFDTNDLDLKDRIIVCHGALL